jgi:uncharacterized iron-regulated membrane protein
VRSLHFGTDWGMTVKMVWALLGFAIPVLTITGLLMYWNRSLGKQWRRRQTQSTVKRKADKELEIPVG